MNTRRGGGAIRPFGGRATIGALGVVLAATTSSRSARAEDAIAAQALFDQAKKAMAAHDYVQACPKFEESLRLQAALGTELNLALCYEQGGRLASAWSKFLEVSTRARAAGQPDRAKIARDRATALAPKLSNLVIEVPPAARVAGLEVRRDSALAGPAEWDTPIPADAGPHTIEVTAPGRKPVSLKVALADGASTMRVTIPELEVVPVTTTADATPSGSPSGAAPPAPPPGADQPKPGSGLRVAAFVAGGVGVAGLAVGGVFGVMSLLRHNDAQSACSSNPCSDSNGVQLWSDAVNFGNIATVGFIVGGVAAAAGITLWIASPKQPEHPAASAQVVVGPGNVAFKAVW